jgi:hypothetical protein
MTGLIPGSNPVCVTGNYLITGRDSKKNMGKLRNLADDYAGILFHNKTMI